MEILETCKIYHDGSILARIKPSNKVQNAKITVTAAQTHLFMVSNRYPSVDELTRSNKMILKEGAQLIMFQNEPPPSDRFVVAKLLTGKVDEIVGIIDRSHIKIEQVNIFSHTQK